MRVIDHMKRKLVVSFLSVICALFSNVTFAWVQNDNVTIENIYQFEAGINRDYAILEFSNNGPRCRVPFVEKELYSLALSLYMAGKTVSVVCHDSEEDPGGSTKPSHKLHRLYAQ